MKGDLCNFKSHMELLTGHVQLSSGHVQLLRGRVRLLGGRACAGDPFRERYPPQQRILVLQRGAPSLSPANPQRARKPAKIPSWFIAIVALTFDRFELDRKAFHVPRLGSFFQFVPACGGWAFGKDSRFLRHYTLWQVLSATSQVSPWVLSILKPDAANACLVAALPTSGLLGAPKRKYKDLCMPALLVVESH
jgi:hypothetical protein